MSLVVLGLSHRAAPLEVLERVALSPAARSELEDRLLASAHVGEAIVLSTCNRTEVYAETRTFHGALSDIADALSAATSVDFALLQPHLYVHYEDRGVAHLFSVAAGLESMAIGEAQVLGQLRKALTRAQRRGHVGPQLNAVVQQALRVGKRVHTETGIDDVSRSLIEAGIDRAVPVVGPITGAHVLVIGAGGMSSLAATTALRAGSASVTIVNRSEERAIALADRIGGRARPLDELAVAVSEADVVISCTGATGQVVRTEHARVAGELRDGRPQVFVDLALPHDVDLAVGSLPHATRVGLDSLGSDLSGVDASPQVEAATTLVTGEVAAYVTARAAQDVAPTVAALRTRARHVVEDELVRLERRLPDLADHDRDEVRLAIHRVVEKLLHTPTVRVKEMASNGQGGSYARALSELFDLDPRDISVVSTAPAGPTASDDSSPSGERDLGEATG